MSTRDFVGDGVAMYAARIALVARLRDEVAQLGGTLPQKIANLLDCQGIIRGQGAAYLGDGIDEVLNAAENGSLTADKADELLKSAAARQQLSQFRIELARNSEPAVMARVGRALVDGGADNIIDSLRPAFDEAVTVLDECLALVDLSSDYDTFVNEASPDQLLAFQRLRGAAETSGRILTFVSNAFGPDKDAPFPVVAGIAGGEIGHEFSAIPNTAPWIADPSFGAGGLISEARGSRAYTNAVYSQHTIKPQNMGMRAQFGDHVRIGLRLNTTGEARALLRAWAEVTFQNGITEGLVGRIENPHAVNMNKKRATLAGEVEVLVGDAVEGVV
ncbi:hypothetical protein [Mycobacteroides abscessus]|uniref:hypothetical protein n=1 Tax=Mycobacteroides abscessus TaxID=36809 RepID=UPI000268345F|nr:hypothetical protein [Mycobacteroides abscessus]EIT90878.1 hypothetical protein MA4S0303_4683 [Mycobacteroides abscessus 4S-0303]EIT92877.1 hypothetical protein MA4S0726RB_4213 [Mycobacteroides abscessus 4S-0726-RB]EIT96422.1 hypothetical protein MA4S0726RA_4619 [Mycobacteroides abscessus 4S-0726-RA]EIV07630.1 hypothetical protein MA4S0206_4688 [Mycobacteroides abscessus 4S-0206]EIV46898.1 hypothetical protein MA4S0116R_4639 [Mycobacteroides abscessus 4S-0116-R]